MELTPTLASVYRATTYWAETPQRCYPLRIDQRHPDFDAFLQTQGASEWAFVTACNPRSEVLTPRENRERTAALEAALAGRTFWPALGVGPGEWYPEASFCAIISQEEALALARKFEQHAIVAGKTGEPARLVLAG